MGMDALQLTWKDGEMPLDPTLVLATGYFGGQPAAINASGFITKALTATPKYLGMFKNSWTEDAQNGNVTIIPGATKVVFFNGSNQLDTLDAAGNTVEGAPYDTAQTYAYGEYLYIDAATGKWTNVAAGNGTAKGIITKPATTSDGSMHAYMFMVV